MNLSPLSAMSYLHELRSRYYIKYIYVFCLNLRKLEISFSRGRSTQSVMLKLFFFNVDLQ